MEKSPVRTRRPAFTLVELLVVVTIIVILMALLSPALSRATYQAQLVSCAGKLKLVSSAVTVYAMEFRRTYPERGLRSIPPDATPVNWISAMKLNDPGVGYDMRPLLSTLMDINKALQCPLTNEVELRNLPGAQDDDVIAEASYTLWWGWRYDVPSRIRASGGTSNPQVNQSAGNGVEAGMYRLGDRFTWTSKGDDDKPRSVSFNILAGDIDLRYDESSQTSHPDREPSKMGLITAQDELLFTSRATVSRWLVRGDKRRGLVDVNYTFDDGAVQRYNNVPHFVGDFHKRDKRFDLVPIQYDKRRGDPTDGWNDAIQLPYR
jgi:prepilin-type N-terminal cleavage/methylation domain-containing protein